MGKPLETNSEEVTIPVRYTDTRIFATWLLAEICSLKLNWKVCVVSPGAAGLSR